MKRYLLQICLLTLLMSGVSQAGNGRASLVVDPSWLAAHLHDPQLVLLHVGDADEYQRAHIHGARLVTLDDLSVSEHTSTGLMLEMPAADDLRQRLPALGISDDSKVVVYYGKDWVSPSTRVLFTLQYAGLVKQAVLLDGGMDAWKAAGGEVNAEPVAATIGELSPLNTQALVVDADYVRAHLHTPGTVVIDARAGVYYDGIDEAGAHGQIDKRGHIRGAHSIPFTELTNEQLLLRPQSELRQLFEAAGVAPGDTVLGYCHIGQQATAMLFAARLLGHPVLLYDGSYQDWSRAENNPVENPADHLADRPVDHPVVRLQP